jgi:geranylgeranyl diphosphate synthase type I
MTARHATDEETLGALRARVDEVLRGWLRSEAAAIGAIDARAPMLVEEIERLVLAGGKRLRPAFCIWGYRSAPPIAPGAWSAEPILRAAAALELLHTMALIHDDLIDGATQRRGVAASAPHLTSQAQMRGLPGDPLLFGRAAALLAGDLAAVLADRLMLASGFEPAAIVRALAPYHEMRLDMASGQLLDVAGLASEPGVARHAARLKGGSYTVEGPLVVGAALADAGADVVTALRSFGGPLGEAFQLRDDLHDRDGGHGATPATVNELVARARAALVSAPIEPTAAAALDDLAGRVAMV